MVRKTNLVVIVLFIFLLFCSPLGAQGGAVALQFSIGTQGSLSFAEAGIVFPSLGNNVYLGLKARIMSSLTWTTFIHQSGESVSFHPVVAGGIVTVGGASPLIEDVYRMYGGMDFLLGYTFTPYDSGGGYKSLFCDKKNMYAVASSWLGSGFGIKTRMRFYF